MQRTPPPPVAPHPDGGLEREVADEAQKRGHETEACHCIGGYLTEAAGQDRVAGPDKGRDEGADITWHVFGACIEGAAPGDQHHDAGKAEQRSGDVRPPQMLARQQRSEQPDKERPEIFFESRFRRWGPSQLREI